MSTALKILVFVAIVLLGSFAGPLVAVIPLKFGWVETLPHDDNFKLFYFGIGGMIWIVASIIGISSFYFEGAARIFTLFLPLIMPLAYSVLVLAYFFGI